MKTYQQICRELRAQKYAPVYFLYGEEPYYIDKVADWIEHYALDETEKSFDQQVFYGRDIPDINPVIMAAKRFPMMAKRQVIILKEAQVVKKWDNLENYLQSPADTAILVICYKGKIDKRLKGLRSIDKSPYAMESAPLRDYQINKWILDYIRDWNAQAAATKQVRIDERVVQLLADSLGNDLTRITLELKKLIDGRPEGCQLIDASLVERNIGISKDFNVFELQQAFVDRDILKANRITQYFADNKKEHSIQKELTMVFGFFSNLMIFHYLPDKSDQAAAAALKISPYLVKDYRKAAQVYSKGKTFHIIGYIREIDARSKGVNNPSAGDADLWKELVYKIMH